MSDLNLTGTQTVYSSDALSVDSGTIANGGLLYNSGTLVQKARGTLLNSGGLTNYGSLAVSGGLINYGVLQNVGTASLPTAGTLTNAAGATLNNVSGGLIQNFGTIENYGTINNATGYAVLNNFGLLTNAGTINVAPDAFFNNDAGTVSNATGAVIDGAIKNGATVVNDGVIRNSGGAQLFNAGTVAGTGTMYGTLFNLAGGVIQGGDLVGGTYSGTLSFQSATIENHGTIRNASLNQGAVLSNYGTASGTLIGSGASEWVIGGASNEVVSAGGTLTVVSGGSVSGDTISSGGELILAGGSASDLTLADGASLDFTALRWNSGETVTVSGPLLEVLDSAGDPLATVTLANGWMPNGATYTVSDDGFGHVLVSVAICYLEGTQILTPTGEVKVETLKAGDTVVTRFGGLQKIRWIGRQSFRGEALKGDWKNIPVHIRAGALGENLPARDLYVSPGHAMLVGQNLLLAKNLVNGVTITQSWIPDQVEYYQLDLGAHDCVLAEGTWSETFADGGTLRDEFHNSADFTARFPNVRAPDAVSLCAPRPEKGEALAQSLAPILARAELKTSGKLRGHVDKVHGGFKVEGWAQDLAHPDFPVTLEVLHDGIVRGEVLACDFRSDLQKAGMGRGYSAFTFVSPIRLSADMHPGLAVRRKSDGALLGMNAEIKKAASTVDVKSSQPPRWPVVA